MDLQLYNRPLEVLQYFWVTITVTIILEFSYLLGIGWFLIVSSSFWFMVFVFSFNPFSSVSSSGFKSTFRTDFRPDHLFLLLTSRTFTLTSLYQQFSSRITTPFFSLFSHNSKKFEESSLRIFMLNDTVKNLNWGFEGVWRVRGGFDEFEGVLKKFKKCLMELKGVRGSFVEYVGVIESFQES